METGRCIQTLRGHTDKVWCVRFDEEKIVRFGIDNLVQKLI